MLLDPPIRPALARRVDALPPGDVWAYEPKFDGWRALIFHRPDGVVVQARSGRLITTHFPDVATAALRLPVGCVIDGEVVIWNEQRIDFFAVQRRALSAPRKAWPLSKQLPASFAAFDILEHDGEDLRVRGYAERRERLVQVVGVLGPPIQPVPSTTSRDQALDWWERWTPEVGIEGLVVKHLDGLYRGGARDWRKYKHWDAR
ncbi:RNA ligase family protein [Streptomyces sp. Amel2xB2]|uniref:ATP-dependent DNA ligase n=1 Tax=Streptomyces sp. Amel2xB2 TaxID=1305829 RepID=UPI0015ECAEC0|nr:RNA ligase family protein [Streptomyces sp. Amel2xB2]